MQRFSTSIVIVIAALYLGVQGLAQSNTHPDQSPEAKAPGRVSAKTLDQIDPGVTSGNVYSNSDLGVSYEFPAGWHVVDRARYKNRIETGHAMAFGDESEAAQEHETAWRCMRVLLWVLRDPEGSETDAKRTDPLVFVGAVNPGCFEGHKFPGSLDDKAALQEFENVAASLVTDSPAEDEKKPQARAYQSQGHIVLEASGPADIDVGENKKPVRVYTTVRITSAGDYWLLWIVMSDSEKELSKLRDLKTTFTSPAATK